MTHADLSSPRAAIPAGPADHPGLAPVPPPPSRRWLKHASDRIVGALGAIVLAPLHALVLAAIVVEDLLTGEGFANPFYLEPRVSAGREFRVVKFRVLKPSRLRALRQQAGGSLEAVKTHEGEPQSVTRVGRLLQRFYLDELPQIWHVVTGRMSLVGPRPIPTFDHERLQLFGRCGMRAGLAGTFQLTKGCGRPMHEIDLEYYREYCRRGQLSLLLHDAGILVRTLLKMRKGEGL